jgi:hypothetical protein
MLLVSAALAGKAANTRNANGDTDKAIRFIIISCVK